MYDVGLLSCNGYTPLDVATATIKDNRELALALESSHLEHVVQLLVAITTSSKNLSSADSEMEADFNHPLSMARHRSSFSTSLEWNPNGGGKCLDFLQSAVWVESKFPLSLSLFPASPLHPLPPFSSFADSIILHHSSHHPTPQMNRYKRMPTL